MPLNCTMKQIVEMLDLKPSSSSSHELRFGKKGSLSVNLRQDIWFDYEAQTGGGMLDFVVHNGKASDQASAAKWLEENGLITPSQVPARKKAIRAHIYRDEGGVPIKKAEKYPDGSWMQFGWHEGNWKTGVKGMRNIPYKLDELMH